MGSPWDVEYNDDKFEKFVESLPEYEQAVLFAAIDHVLAIAGIDICESEWGKALGDGLYEFRVRKSLNAILNAAGVDKVEDTTSGNDQQVLLRVFCTFHGAKIVLLFHGYNKKKDPSERRQNKEIARARKALKAWKRDEKKS